MSDAQANDAQVYSWEDICPSQPTSPSAATSSASQSSYAPSSFISSPSGTTSTLASSPSPLGGHITGSPHHQIASEFDYMAVHDHIPALYAAYQDTPEAMQVAQVIIDLVLNRVQPDNSLINRLIIHDGHEYRCSVNSCPRHSQGSGWSRLDRAREHFRNEHLGCYFPCGFPGCESRYRRRSDLKAHITSHENKVPRFDCGYCHKSYSKRCNLNRHIETLHRARAPRRVRGKAPL